MIERSRAIKCPCIQVHLTGAKIIQQALGEPNALKRFVKDQSIIDRMRATFVDIFSIQVKLKMKKKIIFSKIIISIFNFSIY